MKQSGHAMSRSRNVLRVASFACLALVALPDHAFAHPGQAVQLNARSRLDNAELVLNGTGIRNFLFLDVYQVALFLPRKLSDPQDVLNNTMPRRIRISLLRDVSAERDVEMLLDGMKANNTAEELAAIQAPLDHFLRLIRSLGTVAKGSVVQLDYLPEVGTRVWLNQQFLGNVPGAAFNRALLKIWLGEQPIQKNLKRALLGEVVI
jgi:hypothetical protein